MDLGGIALAPATAADEDFLRAVYASSRLGASDLEDRHPDSRTAVVDAEFASRQRTYAIDFPGVEFFVLELAGSGIGRLYLQRTPAVIFVVDLILLPAWRNQGRGTALLTALSQEAAHTRRRLRLHVDKANDRAFRLYRRLGFDIIADANTHHLLEWREPF